MISDSDQEDYRIEDDTLSPDTSAFQPIRRQKQLTELRTCLAPMLNGQPPINVWLYGPPGSGKTLLARWTTQQVCDTGSSRLGVYVNCWQHRTLYSVLKAITDELQFLGSETQDTNIKFDRIRRALRERPMVIILDEIDRILPANRQETIQGLLGLPKTGIICVANSTSTFMALDDRTQSRLSPALVEVSAYSAKGIAAILSDRADRGLLPGFCSPAIIRRIAQSSGGDARLAINTLRLAGAEAKQNNRSKINPYFIDLTLAKWQAIRQEKRLVGLSEHERIIRDLARQHSPIDATTLSRLYIEYCANHHLQPMARRTFRKYIQRMGHAGVLKVLSESDGVRGRIVQAA